MPVGEAWLRPPVPFNDPSHQTCGDAMRGIIACALFPAIAAFNLLCTSCEGGGRYQRLPESGATLEGTVKYGTDKVQVALIIVKGTESAAQGWVNDDGTYRIENVPLGEVTIAVNVEAGKGPLKGRAMAQSRGAQQGPLPRVIDVPAKYANPDTSDIKTTIEKGDNTFAIVIPK
jgi:hypothetical protein